MHNHYNMDETAVSERGRDVSSSCKLEICAAVYGLCDVTDKVKNLIQQEEQSLTLKVSNDIFGDTWRRHRKTLVIVYRYINAGNSDRKKKILTEGDTLNIRQEPARELPASPDVPGCLWGQGALASEEENSQLNIVFAVYGKTDVTSFAQKKVTSIGEFEEMASDEVWGECSKKDHWSARNTTLVVIYTYSNACMVDIAIRGQKMHFIASPPLCILGAAYGNKNVTEKSMALVKNRSFSATANDKTFEDRWTWRKKILVVVYQYGDETPRVATAIEGEQLEFRYTKSDVERRSSQINPSILTILGAAYGPKDVTEKIQSLVNEEGGSGLQVTADNETFGNPWKSHRKSLVIVSRDGSNEPHVHVVHPAETLHFDLG